MNDFVANLFSTLESLLQQYPQLNELALVVGDAPNEEEIQEWNDLCFSFENDEEWAQHKSTKTKPIVFNKKEYKLGIAFWCLGPLYQYATHQHSTFSTSIILMINADNFSAWNRRRRAILEGTLSLEQEFQFVEFIASKHPKSSELWFHRRWIFNRDPSFVSFEKEMKFCSFICEIYPRNYYCWTYRTYIMTQYYGKDTFKLKQEIESVKQFIKKHIGDYSAMVYIQQLLQLFPKHSSELKELLVDQLYWNQLWVHYFPGHESLWQHRRFLTIQWNLLQQQQHTTTTSPLHVTIEEEENSVINPHFDLEEEILWLQQIIQEEDVQDYEQQCIYALQYLQWVFKHNSFHTKNEAWREFYLATISKLKYLDTIRSNFYKQIILGE